MRCDAGLVYFFYELVKEALTSLTSHEVREVRAMVVFFLRFACLLFIFFYFCIKENKNLKKKIKKTQIFVGTSKRAANKFFRPLPACWPGWLFHRNNPFRFKYFFFSSTVSRRKKLFFFPFFLKGKENSETRRRKEE